jgi:hypothetical protein
MRSIDYRTAALDGYDERLFFFLPPGVFGSRGSVRRLHE